jgi:stress response protein SCP2
MGLHWDPFITVAGKRPADLDALCVLCDSDGAVLEVIDPSHPRADDGSVVHTGDSCAGASTWDDERIFVFLQALPSAVSQVAFLVVCTSSHSFDEVAGAYCHLSDGTSEAEWSRVDLTSLAGRSHCIVALVKRGPSGWSLTTDLHLVAEMAPTAVKRLPVR